MEDIEDMFKNENGTDERLPDAKRKIVKKVVAKKKKEDEKE